MFIRILLALGYAGFGVLFLTIAITFLVTRTSAIVYPIIGVGMLVFLLIYPVGFTFYGCKIYCLLRKSTNVNSKVTKFMFLVNAYFIFMYSITIPVVVGYIWGWDAASFFYGIYRNAVVDTAVCLSIVLMMYVLFVPRRFLAFFGIKAFDKTVKKADGATPTTPKPTPTTPVPAAAPEHVRGALIPQAQQQTTTDA